VGGCVGAYVGFVSLSWLAFLTFFSDYSWLDVIQVYLSPSWFFHYHVDFLLPDAYPSSLFGRRISEAAMRPLNRNHTFMNSWWSSLLFTRLGPILPKSSFLSSDLLRPHPPPRLYRWAEEEETEAGPGVSFSSSSLLRRDLKAKSFGG